MEKTNHSSHSIPFYRDERIINIFTQSLSSILVIGLVIWLAINFKQAAEIYEKVRVLAPDTYGAYFNLGTVYYNLGEYDKAIANYKRALEYTPNNADIHYNLGLLYGAKGMIKEMQRELEISRKLKGH